MMTLSEIQDLVREHARAGSITITSGDFLTLTNFVARMMASRIPWEDLTDSDDTMTTTAGVKIYKLRTDVMNFVDITYIGIQDGDDLDRYKRVVPARTELDWEEAEWLPDDLPLQYRIQGDLLNLADSEVNIEFRPGPKYGSKKILRRGIREPEDLIDENSVTPWRLKFYDDIFALLISGVIAAQRGRQQRSAQLMQMASTMIRENTGREITVREIQDILIRSDQ